MHPIKTTHKWSFYQTVNKRIKVCQNFWQRKYFCLVRELQELFPYSTVWLWIAWFMDKLLISRESFLSASQWDKCVGSIYARNESSSSKNNTLETLFISKTNLLSPRVVMPPILSIYYKFVASVYPSANENDWIYYMLFFKDLLVFCLRITSQLIFMTIFKFFDSVVSSLIVNFFNFLELFGAILKFFENDFCIFKGVKRWQMMWQYVLLLYTGMPHL